MTKTLWSFDRSECSRAKLFESQKADDKIDNCKNFCNCFIQLYIIENSKTRQQAV